MSGRTNSDRRRRSKVERRGGRPRSLLAPEVGQSPSRPAAPLWLRIGLPLLVCAMAFISFMPALDAEFVNWDDDKVLVNNPHFRGFTAENLRWMFQETKMGHYHPLTWLSYAVDHAIGQSRYESLSEQTRQRYENGLDPRLFHLSNVLIHALAVLAFYFLAANILRQISPARCDRPDFATPIAAAVAALLFGCHPLRVENAVWVTERRDVLSAAFLLPCLLCYLNYARQKLWTGKRIAWYAAAVVLLVLSLLSKAWGITVPAVMLVLDVYPLRRLGGRAGWRNTRALAAYFDKIPFVLLAICFAMWAKEAQGTQLSTMKTLEEWGIGDRAAQVFYGLFFYSYKTLLPFKLTPLVPLPPNNNPFAFRYVAAALVVIAVAVLMVVLRKRWPAGLALGVCYTALLSPILGVAQSGPQLVADKYAYLGCLTWALLGGAGLLGVLQKLPGTSRAQKLAPIVGAAVVVVCAALVIMTWRQSTIWQNSHALWTHAVRTDPECAIARLNLGLLERKAGRTAEGIEHYEAALKVEPDNPLLLNNLAVALSENPARLEESIALLERAVRLEPSLPDTRYTLAKSLQSAGRLDEAIQQLNKCVSLKAGQPKYHRALGTIYMQQKQYDAAETHYEIALELELKLDHRGAGVINALDRLGWIKVAQHRPGEAILYFKKILEIDPDNRGAQKGIASAQRESR